jgi:AbrB family looped-hinge helix DNA binding protein
MQTEARTHISDKGRLVIPAFIREALGISPGDALDLRIEDNELRISTLKSRRLRAQERAQRLVGTGRVLSDELSAERRAAALTE